MDLETDAAENAERIRTDPVDGNEPRADGAKLDSAGDMFDPGIHTGTTTPSGRWRRKKGNGREREETPAAAELAPDFHALAQLTVVNLTSALAMIFGPVWSVVPTEERPDAAELDAMTAAWEGYYRAKGVADVPPEMLLALTMFGYAAPRLVHAQTRSRFARARDAARSWWRRWKTRNARSDPRAHGNGEDHSGEAAGGGVPAPWRGGVGLVPAPA